MPFVTIRLVEMRGASLVSICLECGGAYDSVWTHDDHLATCPGDPTTDSPDSQTAPAAPAPRD